MFWKDVNFVYVIPENIRDVPKYVAAMKDHADVFVTCGFSWFYKINILRKMHGKNNFKVLIIVFVM
jgi:hypothetical protein